MRTERVPLLTGAAAVLVAAALFLAPNARAAAPPAENSPAHAPVHVTSDARSVEVAGGDVIWSDIGSACRTSFNAASGSAHYILMPGHCTDGTTQWYADSARTVPIGPTVGSAFPGNDYGLVRYDNPEVFPVGTANGVDITGAGNAYVGQTVMTRSSSTGTHSGTVTAVNQTVDFGGGDVVSGLIRTNLCNEPVTGGPGPATSGSMAIGIPVGGSGSCSTGMTTYYQPVTEALAAYGLTIY
ncbi:S1 family peptidase [Streptomyces meridianus]|uniref:S1 family peptidase n=1 Tax=Streptomyces meridianus TaxID=2938945 RepID=A0ABT0X840_9ACTN|nr:S1 family peptidase [Streptomyces meridianus]MCM2578692.1 S1 family peptidase [Streptomyces meridianus]